MSDELSIRTDGLWKRYGLPLPAWLRPARRRLAGVGRIHAQPEATAAPGSTTTPPDGPWALADLSFEARRGETLGIIGRNGSGKSTLLKILAGVTPPTRGRVEVRGRVFPMIELNAGLNTELTGAENVYVLASIVGLTTRQATALMPQVETFCDIGDWFRRPVRTYSTGMLARLGFAVAMAVPAEILLIDEVIAVGDLGFQKKCFDRIRDLQAQGTTILFVSHHPYQIERLCQRVLCLDRGRRLDLGPSHETIARYHELVVSDGLSSPASGGAEPPRRLGTGDLRVERVRLVDRQGRDLRVVPSLGDLGIRLEYRAQRELRDVRFRLAIISAAQVVVTQLVLPPERWPRPIPAGEGWLECWIERQALLSDSYAIDVVAEHDVLIDWWPRAVEFPVVLNHPRVLRESGDTGIFYTRG